MSLKGTAAIVGIAESDSWSTPDLSPVDLMAQATIRALDDAGLKLSDVDGLCCASSYYWMPTATLAEYLGISPRFSDSSSLGGASFIAHIGHVAAAIAAGLCKVAVIAYGSSQRSDGGRLVSMSETLQFEAPYGVLHPLSAYALAAQRHMYQYGTTPAQLAEVAVAARQWANLNPKAFARGPLTVEDVLTSKVVATPLHRFDCCLVTDGGGALVITSAEVARTLKRKPVYVLGTGEASTHRGILGMPDLTVTGAVQSGRDAFRMAGLKPQEMDFAQLYDAFTINTILFLEDLGFCAKGEGGAFVQNGRIAPGGELPVNTNGGGLSYCHPGMYGIYLAIEAVRQIRGEAGERQLPQARVGVIHGNGGTLSVQCTAILGAERF